MDNMPELREKKKSIDMHINIATALLSQIKRRELNVFATLEDAIISGATGVRIDASSPELVQIFLFSGQKSSNCYSQRPG